MDEVLAILSEHLEKLRPVNKPQYNDISAACTAAKVVDAYLNTVMTCMEYYKMSDQELDFDFMQLGIEDKTKPPKK